MSYRRELEELVAELRTMSNEGDPALAERRRRQAEVLDFLLSHTKDAVANLDTPS